MNQPTRRNSQPSSCGKRRVGDAVKPMAAETDGVAEAVRARGHFLGRIEAVHREIQAVDVFPHLARNVIANGARILARLGDALHDGAGIVLAKRQKLEHGLRVRLAVEPCGTAPLRRP